MIIDMAIKTVSTLYPLEGVDDSTLAKNQEFLLELNNDASKAIILHSLDMAINLRAINV
jgi:hypothetical protein